MRNWRIGWEWEMGYNNVLCVYTSGSGRGGRGGFQESIDMGTKDTSIGPVTRGFCTRWDFHLYNQILLYFSILSLDNYLLLASSASILDNSTTTVLGEPLGIMGHGNGCNIIWD